MHMPTLMTSRIYDRLARLWRRFFIYCSYAANAEDTQDRYPWSRDLHFNCNLHKKDHVVRRQVCVAILQCWVGRSPHPHVAIWLRQLRHCVRSRIVCCRCCLGNLAYWIESRRSGSQSSQNSKQKFNQVRIYVYSTSLDHRLTLAAIASIYVVIVVDACNRCTAGQTVIVTMFCTDCSSLYFPVSFFAKRRLFTE